MSITRRRSLLALLGVAVLLVLASCGTVSAFLDLQRALDADGYSSISVNLDSSSGGSGLRIEADGPPGESGAEATEGAAKIAWESFPRRFDSVLVHIKGSSSQVFDRSELLEKYGPRPSGLDDRSLQDDTESIGKGILIGMAVAFLVIVLIIVLVVVLVRRSRKKRRAAAAAAWQASTAYGGYPPYGAPTEQPGGQPWPPQGYAPPQPPAQGPPPGPPVQKPPGWD